MLLCNAEGADDEWDESMLKIEKEMLKLKTDPSIINALLMGIKSWRQLETVNDEDFDEHGQEAVRKQNVIGWRNLIEGLWSKEWKRVQQEHYNSIESRKSCRQWAVKITK